MAETTNPYPKPRFLAVVIAITVLVLLVLEGVDRYLSFGPEYWIGGPLQIILAGVAISTRNEKFHAVFAIAIILQQASIAARLFPTMG